MNELKPEAHRHLLGEDPPDLSHLPMKPALFEKLAAERRSIRRFLKEPVDLALVEQLLETACQAPSAHNRQPWRFVVLSELAAKHGLAQVMGDRLREDRLADGDEKADVEADIARSQNRITSAPVVIALCLTMEDMDHYPDEHRAQAEYLMTVQSTAMAGQNLLLAAHAHGLGACWMCAPLFAADAVRGALDSPASWEPQGLILLGWPAEEGRRRGRKPLLEVAKFA